MFVEVLSEVQLLEAIESIWITMLGMPVQRTAGPVRDDDDGQLIARISISGEWNGTVVFMPSDRFANLLAAHMLSMSVDSVMPTDVEDAAAEICNMIGGSVKSLLPGHSKLSLPSVTHVAHRMFVIPKERLVAQVDLVTEGEPVRVLVLHGCVQGRATELAAQR